MRRSPPGGDEAELIAREILCRWRNFAIERRSLLCPDPPRPARASTPRGATLEETGGHHPPRSIRFSPSEPNNPRRRPHRREGCFLFLADVADQIRRSQGQVELVDDRGNRVGVVRCPPTEDEIEYAKSRVGSAGPKFTVDEVIAKVEAL